MDTEAELVIKKSYIDTKRWDVLATGLYRVLDGLFDNGTLKLKPKNIKIEEIENENAEEIFILNLNLKITRRKSNMKTITFPVGYRTNYLVEFLACLEQQNLEGYTIFCSAEASPACIKILQESKLDLQILYKKKSIGRKDHQGAIDNMYNVLTSAFEAGSTFNVHLEDDFLLSPDAINLANWYYENFKDRPTTFMSYGLFGFAPRGDDYTALEEVPFFEGLGWCTFKEGWEECYNKAWNDTELVKKYYNAWGWDWSVQSFFKEYNYKSLRPLINRTQHNGRVGGTCCTVAHHDQHYTPLKWNTTERITDFKLTGTSQETADWIK